MPPMFNFQSSDEDEEHDDIEPARTRQHPLGTSEDEVMAIGALRAFVNANGGDVAALHGWSCESVRRPATSSAAKAIDRYYFDPTGRRFRSRTEVARFFGLTTTSQASRLKGERREDCPWVACDACGKWRRLSAGFDLVMLPEAWTCARHPDGPMRCEAEEEAMDDDEQTSEDLEIVGDALRFACMRPPSPPSPPPYLTPYCAPPPPPLCSEGEDGSRHAERARACGRQAGRLGGATLSCRARRLAGLCDCMRRGCGHGDGVDGRSRSSAAEGEVRQSAQRRGRCPS